MKEIHIARDLLGANGAVGDNLKRIHDKPNQNSIFVPKAQSEPQKPPVKGYIDIRASGSGESSYYEERR